jgi:AraC-like DNA-binding protein
MKRYVLDLNWQAFASDMRLSLQDILKYAQLPGDFFTRTPLTVTGDEYFALWHGIAYAMKDTPSCPLVIGTSITPETFNPLIFAALYSRNMNAALTVMAKYKPLVGPIQLLIQQPDAKGNVQVMCVAEPGHTPLPGTFVAAELIMWLQIARLATREHIIPLQVHMAELLPDKTTYDEYFGIRVTYGTQNGMTFSAEDVRKPFLTASTQMMSIFEPILKKRLHEVAHDSHIRDRVRMCLVEIIASGDCSIGEVANRFGMSTRTLQRKLKQETTSFQQELDTLRVELAQYYLTNTDYTSHQIAFLLGYEEPASFFRAFRTWTGQTPEQGRVRKNKTIATFTN